MKKMGGASLPRTNSICPSPEELLLEYVTRNQEGRVRLLVRSHPRLLGHVYEGAHKPVLLIACTEDAVHPETVRVLLQLGADPHHASEEDEGWQALHFVASCADPRKLRVILDHLEPGRINELASGSNALHVLLTYGDADDRRQDLLRCARMLVEAGIDLNAGDANNISPILWAAKKGYGDVVAAILDNGVRPVDIDTHTSRGKTARQLIEEKGLYGDGGRRQLPSPADTHNNNNDPLQIMFGYLQQAKEAAFLNCEQTKIKENVDGESAQYNATLLQYCCREGYCRAAKHLLDNGADPNRTAQKNQRRPVEIAAESGCCRIFELLLEDPRVRVPPQVLSYLITKQNQNGSCALRRDGDGDKDEGATLLFDYRGCYEALMRKLRQNKALLDVNEQDERSNTPLHYTIRYASPERTLELLDMGASLASKNQFGVMPVEDIEPEVLEAHLDNCIEFDADSKKFDKEDFTVTFNYRTLLPPQSRLPSVLADSSDAECVLSGGRQEYVEEMEVVSYMSKAVEFKHLLKHPVIVSFLFMKWHRIRWLFYTNLLFYMIFVLSMVTYIFTSYGNFDAGEERSSAAVAFTYLSYAVLWVAYVVLVVREVFQAVACCEKYLMNFENYLEVVLIVITGCILTDHPPTVDARRQLSALAILLAAFELVLMVGQHPLLSTNVVMLKTVSYNFFKFLLWYSLLIVAFSMSFYLLFAEAPGEHGTTADADGAGDDGENSFGNPGKSVFKTIVMLTGEFDASDLNFSAYPVLSKVIFVMFVFMIAIILLNLLTGLAVSDTQMIKNDAELVGHVARAAHVRYVETMLLGEMVPGAALRALQALCCCCRWPGVNPSVYRSLRPLAGRACIFPEVLNYELTVYPNKGGQVEMGAGRRNVTKKKKTTTCRGCGPVRLDRETIRRTNALVHARRERLAAAADGDGADRLAATLRALQDEQAAINGKLDEVKRKLDEIINGRNG